jgi:hypothetical protein
MFLWLENKATGKGKPDICTVPGFLGEKSKLAEEGNIPNANTKNKLFTKNFYSIPDTVE